jgi:hypothetical protein
MLISKQQICLSDQMPCPQKIIKLSFLILLSPIFYYNFNFLGSILSLR